MGRDFEFEEVVETLLTIGIGILERLENRRSVVDILFGLDCQVLEEPVFQILGDGEGGEECADLGFKLSDLDALLRAVRPFSLGAVIVLVAEVFSPAHLGDGCLAGRTTRAVASGELALAPAADDLRFGLGRDGGAALAAVQEAGEGKGVMLRTGPAVSAQELLNPPKFFLGDHGLVFPLIPIA